MDAAALRVFHHDEWTLLKTVPAFISTNWKAELNGFGYGEFTIDADDLDPDDLRQFDVIGCYLDSARVFSWQVEAVQRSSVSDAEESDDAWVVSGRGIGSALSHVTVQSEHKAADDPAEHIQELAPDQRPFTFASLLYDESEAAWGAVTEVGTVAAETYTEQPQGWPDSSGVWVSAESTFDEDNGPTPNVQYFRGTFTNPDPTIVRFYAACVGRMEVFVDGVSMLSVQGVDATANAEAYLPSGEHQVAIRYKARSGHSGMVALSIGKITGYVSDVAQYDWYARADDTWIGLSNPAQAPGWTPGRVIRLLIEEFNARAAVSDTDVGVGQFSQVALLGISTFDDDTDSDGVAWTARIDRYWQMGTDLATIMEEMAESAIEFFVDPDGDLKVYNGQRGEQTEARLTVASNLTDLTHDVRYGKANAVVLYRTRDAWGESRRQINSENPRREGFMSLGTANSHDEAERIITRTGELLLRPTTVTTARVISETNARPFRDFSIGDSLWCDGPGVEGSGAGEKSYRTLAINVSCDEDENVDFVPELVVAYD